MARKLVVEIIGDASKLDRELSKASRSATRFGSQTTRGIAAGSGAFQGLGRSVAFASAAFLGGAGFTAVAKGAVEAATNLSEQVNKANVVFGRGGADEGFGVV